MAFVEEVFKNKGGLFGGHTGKKYEKSETEDKGAAGVWSKPSHCAPNFTVKEVEDYEEKD